MKRIGSILSVVVIVSILVSSCTSQKNGLAIKRKYNKGYYITHNHKKNNEVTKQHPTNKTVAVAEEKKVAEEKIEAPSVKASLSTISPKQVDVEKTPKINELKHNTILVDTKTAIASTKSIKTKVIHAAVNIEKKEKKSSSSDSDTQLIILVILCLFPILALVAIYLKDGKQITLNFWIDLLLHFLFLYWLFALLVVLDVINLA